MTLVCYSCSQRRYPVMGQDRITTSYFPMLSNGHQTSLLSIIFWDIIFIVSYTTQVGQNFVYPDARIFPFFHLCFHFFSYSSGITSQIKIKNKTNLTFSIHYYRLGFWRNNVEQAMMKIHTASYREGIFFKSQHS